MNPSVLEHLTTYASIPEYLAISFCTTPDHHPQTNLNNWSCYSWNKQGMPQSASSTTLCNYLHLFSHDSIAFNLMFTAYTLYPAFPNCLSPLQEIKPTPSHVRNHNSLNIQDAHIQRALIFSKQRISKSVPMFAFHSSSFIRYSGDDK
jgi:hypothetical protein